MAKDIHEALGRTVSIIGGSDIGAAPKLVVNPDLLSGEGGIAVLPGATAFFAEAFRRASAQTTDPAQRSLLAYKIAAELAAEKEKKAAMPTPAPAPVPRPAKKQSATAPRRAVASDPRIDQLCTTVAALQSAVSQLVTPAATAVAAIPTPQPKEAAPETMSTKNAVAFVEDAFSKLGIPGLGPAPKKPEFRVEFELAELGRMQARYHWVGVHADCVFLVYDTRFEFGTLFEPPVLGRDRPVTLRIRTDNGDTEFRVASLDLTHPFGVFYIISLPIVEEVPLSRQQHSQLFSSPETEHGI